MWGICKGFFKKKKPKPYALETPLGVATSWCLLASVVTWKSANSFIPISSFLVNKQQFIPVYLLILGTF